MLDVALIQISPPDQDGNCSLGVSVDFVPPILPDCGRVIAEMNEQMPAPPGSPKIPLDRVDYALRTDRSLKRDEIWLNRHHVLALCLSMIFSENRFALFRIML